MNNLFNSTGKTVSHLPSFGKPSSYLNIDKLGSVKESACSIDKKKKVAESGEKLDKHIEKCNKDNKKKAIQNTITHKADALYNEGCTEVFKSIILDMYTKSLFLDEDYVLENFNAISNYVDSYIDKIGGFSVLEKACAKNKSKLLKNVKGLCETTSKKVCNRVKREADELEDLKFELNDDEKKEFEYNKDNLGIDQIKEVVKDKVLNVVLEEKKREEKSQELQSDIEEELSNDDSLQTEEQVREAAENIVFNKAENTASFFNALMRGCYKSMVCEGTAVIESNLEVIEIDDIDEEDFFDEDDDFLDDDEREFGDDDDFAIDEVVTEYANKNIIDIMNRATSIVSTSLNEKGEVTGDAVGEALSLASTEIKNLADNTNYVLEKSCYDMIKDIRAIEKDVETTPEMNIFTATVENFIDEMNDAVEVLESKIAKNDKMAGNKHAVLTDIDLKKIIRFNPNNATIKIIADTRNIVGTYKRKISSSKTKAELNTVEKFIDNCKAYAQQQVKKVSADKRKANIITKYINKLDSLKQQCSEKIKSVTEDFIYNPEAENIGAITEAMAVLESVDFDDDYVEEATTIDADVIMGEALMKYTMMELTNTIRLESFTPIEIEQMTKDLIRK